MVAKVNIHIDNYDSLDGEYPNGYVLTTDENSPIGVSFQAQSGGGGELTQSPFDIAVENGYIDTLSDYYNEIYNSVTNPLNINDSILNLSNNGALFTNLIANVNSNDSIETKYFNVRGPYANAISSYSYSVNAYHYNGSSAIIDYYPEQTIGDGGVSRENKHIWAKNWNQIRSAVSSPGSYGAIGCNTNANSNLDAIFYDYYQNSAIYIEQDFFIPIDGFESTAGVFCGVFSGAANNMFVNGNNSTILSLGNLSLMPNFSSFFGIGAFSVDTNLQVLIGKKDGVLQKVALPFNKNGLSDIDGTVDGQNGYFRVKIKADNDAVKIQLTRVIQGVLDNNFVEIDLSQNTVTKEALNLIGGAVPSIRKYLAPSVLVYTPDTNARKVAFSKMFYEKGSRDCIKKHFVEMSAQEKLDFPSQYIQVGN